jgi:hypothetical protein
MISKKMNLLRNKENIQPLNKAQQENLKHNQQVSQEKRGQELFNQKSIQDPQCVPQFFVSIENQLIQTKHLSLPCPNYMSRQSDINEKMRAILIDWLVDVCLKYKMRPQTLFIVVDVVDRFLSQTQIKRNHLQLVGISALMLVAKYEEIYPPNIKEYVTVCDNAYTREQLLEQESQILLALEFNLVRPTSLEFLELFQQRLGLQEGHFVFARYLLENCLLDYSCLLHDKLSLAAGAVFLVNRIFKVEMQSFDFESIFQVSYAHIKETAKTIYQTMCKNEKDSLQALKRKFASKSLFEVSKYRIEKVQSKSE